MRSSSQPDKVDLLMSDHWDAFHRRVSAWQRTGDTKRLRLVELYQEAHHYRETIPERKLELLTRARDEARRLGEPWWVLFFEYNRLSTLTADLHDFARALPLAVELLVRFNGPEGCTHEHRIDILTLGLYALLQVDPIGYRRELEDGFADLDAQVPQGVGTARYVLDYRRAEYLSETERWEEAFVLSSRSLALAEQDEDRMAKAWWGAWILFRLCGVCDALGRYDRLAVYADDMRERSEGRSDLQRTRASALIWLAVTGRAAGDEQAALRSFQQGTRWLERLDSRDEICADALARYHELGGDLEEALGIRDRELAVVTRKGMNHRACRVEIERCRLLSRTGTLTPADVGKARAAAAKMRVPNWYLGKLDRLGTT